MMKSRGLTAAVLLMVLCSLAVARPAAAGEFYGAVHAGKIKLTEVGKRSLNEDHFSGGVLLGSEVLSFDEGTVAAEADFSFPLAKGSGVDRGAWKLTTAGLYGCVRLGGRSFYAKGRLGVVYEKLSIDDPYLEGDDDFGLSVGAGLGFRPAERVYTEIDITLIDKEMSYLRALLGYTF